MYNCTQCTYSTPQRGNLQRHLETKHEEKSTLQLRGNRKLNHVYETELFPTSQQHATHFIPKQEYIGNFNELLHSTMSQQQQYEQALKNLESFYKDHIQFLHSCLPIYLPACLPVYLYTYLPSCLLAPVCLPTAAAAAAE